MEFTTLNNISSQWASGQSAKLVTRETSEQRDA